MKKFFKILMVLALLSGAALSCTKDYSKEIADVQKQNQELDGLIAALQNALNSTNTTVSQISDLTGKNKEDILALATENAETFAEIIASHGADVEYLEELIDALEAAGVKQGTEIYDAIDALKAAQDKALVDAIAALEVKDAAAAKVAADALDAAKKELEKAIADGNAATAKAAADALDEAVAKLEKAIADGNAATAKDAADALDAAVNELKEKIESDADVAADALAAARTALEGMIADGDKAVEDAAKKALAEAKTALEGKIDSEIATLKNALADEIARAMAKEDALAADFAARIAALVTKTEADIAAINEALANKADKSDVQAKYDALSGMIETLQAGLNTASSDIEELIKDLGDTDIKVDNLKEYTEENFDKTSKAIAAAVNRLDALEEMLSDYPEVKAQVAANKAGMEANAAAIEELKKDAKATQEKVVVLEAQVKENKDACEKAIEEINAAIKTLQEQVEVLSARLTNIVAAPAKAVELLSVKIGDSTFVNLQMDFKVAPADFAKTIAEGVESGDVNVALNITSGYTRTKGNAVSEDIDTLVTPFKVVSTKDGVISVTANLSGIVNTPAVEPVIDSAAVAPAVFGIPSAETPDAKARYVSIIVSGTDYEGMQYERISDPVRPIEGTIADGDNILTALKWFKDGKPVASVANTDDAIKAIKAVNEKKDTAVVADKGHLKVVLADIDWKTYGTFSNTNVLEGYELMIPVGEGNPFNKPISIKEIAEMLNISYKDVFAPYFAKPATGGTLTIDYKTQIEWTAYPDADGSQTAAEKKLFTAQNPKGIEIGIGVDKLPEGTNPEKAEFVGLWYEVKSNKIVYGKVDTLDQYDVYVVQRIGKHVSNNEVAAPLTVHFAYNAGDPDTYTADHSNTKFTAVPWKGDTDIARHNEGSRLVKKGDNYTEENYVKYMGDYATATVTATTSQTKFADIELANVPFQDKVQEYELVWLFEPYINLKGVQAEDYLDYIDVTVKPYHPEVPVVDKGVEDYVSLTDETSIETGIIISNNSYNSAVFGPDSQWNGGKNFATAAEKQEWNNWYLDGFGDEDGYITADTLGKKVNGYEASNVRLKYAGAANGSRLSVKFNAAPAAIAGESYTIHAVDTIDNVIAFDYTIPFKALPIRATIATIPGFVQEGGVVNVIGAAIQDEETWCYRIPDINLDNYFRFVNLDQINENDLNQLTVNFSKPSNVSVLIDENTAGPGTYSTDQKQATLSNQCKVSWSTYNKTEFELTADTKVESMVIAEPVKVTFKTVDPVAGKLTVPDTTVAFVASEAQTISVLNGLQIKPVGFDNLVEIGNDSTEGILVENSETTPSFGFVQSYPTAGAIETWRCTVEGNPFTLETLIYTEEGSYGWQNNMSDFTIETKPHDALGRIVITIPFTWDYMFGTLKFDAIIVIE